MITLEEAEQIALAKWNTPERLLHCPNDPILIAQERTIEKPYGWIFSWISERFLKYGDRDSGLPHGAGQVIVDREGKIYQLGTGLPLEMKIAMFEEWLVNNQENKDG